MFSTVYRIYDGGSIVEIESNNRIILSIIRGHRALTVGLTADGTRHFLEALGNVIEGNPRILMRTEKSCRWYDDCIYVEVPDRELIAHIVQALRQVLANAPRPVPCVEEDHCDWIWSPEEARAASKAALLIDLAAAILRQPELVDKLPPDTELLTRKIPSILDYAKKQAEAKAQAEG